LDYASCAHIGRKITGNTGDESKNEIQEMGLKSKHSYWNDWVKRRSNGVAMESRKSIVARFYQLETVYAHTAKYL
jgi:hypothetical protein